MMLVMVVMMQGKKKEMEKKMTRWHIGFVDVVLGLVIHIVHPIPSL